MVTSYFKLPVFRTLQQCNHHHHLHQAETFTSSSLSASCGDHMLTVWLPMGTLTIYQRTSSVKTTVP